MSYDRNMTSMRNWVGFIILLPFISCKEKNKDYSIAITIKDAQTSEYDLKNMIYKIHFRSRSDTVVKFTLSEKERKSIVDKYYALNLEQIMGTTLIEDGCMIMPKVFTTLTIYSKDGKQVIDIDEECDDFSLFTRFKAKRIKSFLAFVRNILKHKPEINNAPSSDVYYL